MKGRHEAGLPQGPPGLLPSLSLVRRQNNRGCLGFCFILLCDVCGSGKVRPIEALRQSHPACAQGYTVLFGGRPPFPERPCSQEGRPYKSLSLGWSLGRSELPGSVRCTLV